MAAAAVGTQVEVAVGEEAGVVVAVEEDPGVVVVEGGAVVGAGGADLGEEGAAVGEGTTDPAGLGFRVRS